MTKHPTAIRSDSLQQQTRAAIAQIPVSPDGNLHFKHATQDYAHVTVVDLCKGGLLLHTHVGGEVRQFDDVEALLRAGWVVD